MESSEKRKKNKRLPRKRGSGKARRLVAEKKKIKNKGIKDYTEARKPENTETDYRKAKDKK